jgi:Ca2+:H+ antiporter
MMPLEKMFEFGGEQLALYCGKDIGDLIIITMNK